MRRGRQEAAEDDVVVATVTFATTRGFGRVWRGVAYRETDPRVAACPSNFARFTPPAVPLADGRRVDRFKVSTMALSIDRGDGTRAQVQRGDVFAPDDEVVARAPDAFVDWSGPPPVSPVPEGEGAEPSPFVKFTDVTPTQRRARALIREGAAT